MIGKLDDKDEFNSEPSVEMMMYSLKEHLWEQIQGHFKSQGGDWRVLAQELEVLLRTVKQKALETTQDNDEVTPEDLPQRPQ